MARTIESAPRATIIDQGDAIRITFDLEGGDTLLLTVPAANLGKIIRQLQSSANSAFDARRQAGKPPIAGEPSIEEPFEAMDVACHPSIQGKSVLIEASDKLGRMVDIRLPLLLAEGLHERLGAHLSASRTAGSV